MSNTHKSHKSEIMELICYELGGESDIQYDEDVNGFC